MALVRFTKALALATRRPRPKAVGDRRDFDWRAYKAAHRDVGMLTSAEAVTRHWETIGRPQGRLGSAEAIAMRLRLLKATYGPLPPDFAWVDYLAGADDLTGLMASYEAAEHYLRHGRAEGRIPSAFDATLYRALTFPGVTLSEAALRDHWRTIGVPTGLIGTSEALVAPYGLPSAAWLKRLDVSAFALLNESWAGPVATIAEALAAMVREGFDRLAPIARDQPFEPAYYREANPGLKTHSDAALYRHWLFQGFEGGRPGSAADHLARHGLPLGLFPEGFHWLRYRGRPGVQGDSRWALLDHLVANNAIAAADIPVRGAAAGTFLAALGMTIADRVPARGAALFAAAQRHGPLSAAAAERWGHAMAAEQDWAGALAAFEGVIERGGATIGALEGAVAAALALRESDRASAALSACRPTMGGDPRFRQAVRTTIEHRFAEARAIAERLYAAERRPEADAILESAVGATLTAWSELDPIGLPVPPEPTLRVVLLANVDLAQCTHYRVTQKREIFAAAGVPLAVFTEAEVEAFLTALPGSSAALFYRLPATPLNVRAIAAARALGIPTYYDIDDLIFDSTAYPEPIETYGAAVTPEFYHALQLGVPLFRAALALCDHAIAATTALAERMAPLVRSGRSFVLPNGLDSTTAGDLANLRPKVRRDGSVVLFYGSGTTAHNSDFIDLVGGALLTLLTRHPHVTLVIAGSLSLGAAFDAVRGRIVQLGWIADRAAYAALLAEADINLAVLAPGPTTDVKSEIKWLEAATLGVASVVSPTDRYREVLTDGTDALFAGTPAGWLAALETLIAHPERRAALVTAAREKARAAYGLDSNAARLKVLLTPAFEAAARNRVPARPRKARLLLVNIFFPPQTVGGSTRVVRDNLDAFLASPFAQDCDFAVLTSDNDNPVPHRLRVDDYRGVPVFRISVPAGPLMEWQPADPMAAPLFGRILDAWQPDLIHVHSIQRLTGSILEECWRRAIPTINTLHDAWWVSDYQFLVDGRGRSRAPEEPLPLDPPPQVSLGASLERRRRLRLLLENSVEILSVSEAFTALHHRAGYPRTRTIANGLPPMGPVTRTLSATGRVRLAQIGSQTHHKGYHLVEAAFRQGRFRTLELTVIDHARFGGPPVHSRWGETPVVFVGKTRQEDMHAFYGTVDVLLAPSVWPESFGLVTREAIEAGLWVVASDRGAIGDAVTPGVNGWVIDVATLQPLVDTLAAIDADPARYTRPPPRPPTPLRRAEDQARELIDLYRDVLGRPRPDRPLPRFLGEDAALPPALDTP